MKLLLIYYVDPHLFLSLPFSQDHTCVLNSIVGWDSTIGRWARVEGTPSDPNPNDPYAKIDSETLFRDGRLTPSITILGKLPSSFFQFQESALPTQLVKEDSFISKYRLRCLILS